MAVNRNNLKQSPIPVVPRTMQLVNPDGTVTRSGQLLLEQTLNLPVGYGSTHADMTSSTDLPDGSFFCLQEGGASEVLYQLQGGEWHYVSGTMWGTLSPDQRPTGLGPNDAGFDFRAVDSDPQYSGREFLWSGSRWVEITPAQFGGHGARLALVTNNVVNGELFIESDRSGVIYQNQGGTWHFLAGTMWGTISPDNRPTDLGVNDAGFAYRGTDQQREFIWGGTAWAETSSAVGLLTFARATAALTLTTTATTIPGVTVTLTRKGTYLITGCFDFSGNGTGDDLQAFFGQVSAGGTALPGQAVDYPVVITGTINGSPLGSRKTIFQQWQYTAASTGIVAALQAWKTGGTGTSTAEANSSISALWVSP
jgi:hypothetical protein